MPRIQKKKKTGIKKKKKTTSGQSGALPSQKAAAKQNASAALSSREVKKRSAPVKKSASSGSASGSGKKRKNYLDIVTQFLREVVMELKKVTWPSRKQTTGSTVVMLILVAIISLFLGTVDIGLSKLVQAVLQ